MKNLEKFPYMFILFWFILSSTLIQAQVKETQKSIPSAPQLRGNFGSVALNGSRAKIGVGGENTNVGAAYISKKDASEQLQTSKELVGHWTFEQGVELKDLTGNFSDLILQGNATVSNGQLDVGVDDWAQAISYSGPDITEKTLVSWASIDSFDVQGGTILTVDNYVVDEFDGIVFGEKENHRWMVGSGFFNRYEALNPGYEETTTGELVQMAITFANVDGEAHMTVYHNGELIGEYTKGTFKEFVGVNTEVVFGKRHTFKDGTLPLTPWLNAHIEEARIYTGVLTQAEIQALNATKPELVNPGFELPPTTPGVADIKFYDASQVPGWSTTASDNMIEFWTDSASDVAGGQVISYEGTQHVELNANIASALYQDVEGIASGASVGFEFAHRGRSGIDEMQLTITDLGADNQAGGGDDTQLFQKNYRTDNTAWAFYTSATEPVITALGNKVRFSYEAISTASGNNTIGNFIDATGLGLGFGSAQPEIAVNGGNPSVEILSGDATPDSTDGTDFGTAKVNNTVSRTYTIYNYGDAALSFASNPVVEITGTDAASFTVSQSPAPSLPAGDSTTFTVDFTPTREGVHTASIVIANNDADENPYEFSIQGSGEPVFKWIGSNGGSAFIPGGRIRVVDGRPVNSNANQSAYQNLSNLTIEAWVFPTRVPEGTSSDSIHQIVTRPVWVTNPWEVYDLRIVNKGQGPKFEFKISNGEADNWAEATTSENVEIGKWYHIAGTYDGQTIRLYVDGQLTAETAYAAGLGAGNAGFYVGGPLPGQHFHGFIDDLRLWNVARTDSAINAVNNVILSGNEDNLAGYWTFDGFYNSNGYYVFGDKTQNNNELVVQGAGYVIDFPLDEPKTSPYISVNDGLLPVTGVINQEFRFKLSFEGWPLPTVTISGAPTGLELTEGNEIVWTPNDRQAGLHTFTITANNGYDVAQKTVSIWVDIVAPQNVVSDNGSIQFTATNKGLFGDYTGLYNEPKFAYKGYESLFSGALLVGSDSILVGALYQDHFAPVSEVIEVPSDGSFDIVTTSRYNDSKVGNPLNIVVTQNTLMSSLPELSNVVLIHYEIKNINSFPLHNVNVGMAMDFDLGTDPFSDLAGFNDDANLQYVYDSNKDDNPYYFGLTLLSHEVGGAGEWYNGDPESYDDQLKLLNQFRNNIENPGDIRTLIGSKKLTIPARGSVSVVFAAIVADNLEDLIGLSLGLKDAINTPTLYSSIDVPFDQGGKVQLRWLRSREDTKDVNQFYSIWRSISNYDNPGNIIDPKNVTKDFKGGVMIESSPFGTQTAWEWLGNQMAYGFDEYAYTAETLYDSSALTEGWHDFMVIYHGKNGESYQSPVISGYSVDNLAPIRPGGLAGRVDGQNSQLILTWNRNTEEDLSKYLVYRSATPEFDFANLTPIGETKDTTYIDDVSEITEAYYAVVAEDIHNNRSNASSAYAYQLTGVDEFGKGIPEEFSLYQNFPNPFNPSTVIRYGLKEAGFVNIKVYDLLGSEVAELVNESQNAGYYTINFDANELAAGIYIYRLTVTGKYQAVNKMILLK